MQYHSTQYINKIYLPLEVIKDAIDHNWLDSLCYYVWLKKLYSKPIIYNYSLRKIGALISCSPTTVNTHIQVLKKRGLCETIGPNLLLISTTKLKVKYASPLVPVGVSKNKSDQRNLLRFVLTKNNLHNQYRSYSKKDNILKFLHGERFAYNETKKLMRQAKAYTEIQLENSIQSDLTLSNKRLGNICNRSQSTGIKIQKSLNKLGLIRSSTRVKIIDKGHNRRSFFAQKLGSTYFLTDKGVICQRLSNKIEIGRICTIQ